MSQSATPATQNDMTTCLETFEKDRFCSFPHRHGEAKENKRLETRHMGAPKQAFRARLPPILTLCSLRIRQFSVHLTKCHACHGICTLSPLDATLPMRFAKNTQHDTSKVLRLPRKMTMDPSKVLRLPRKMPRIF